MTNPRALVALIILCSDCISVLQGKSERITRLRARTDARRPVAATVAENSNSDQTVWTTYTSRELFPRYRETRAPRPWDSNIIPPRKSRKLRWADEESAHLVEFSDSSQATRDRSPTGRLKRSDSILRIRSPQDASSQQREDAGEESTDEESENRSSCSSCFKRPFKRLRSKKSSPGPTKREQIPLLSAAPVVAKRSISRHKRWRRDGWPLLEELGVEH
ncbi:hypothetical protein FOZ63_031323 [Perkinsus olseni]|uniref:Uncharacterized protein n=1 Tax=Perkinsus olseni TaxID=32597 RepID=A0A7J6PI26_PEROL|nr:hypothetical protein FOZ63_031323 [Perkinsus olseni]